VLTGVDQRDPPRFRLCVVDLGGVASEVEGHVAGVQEVVREELLDDVALVPEAHDEVGDAVLGVDLHDVPEDRASPDLDHRLRTDGGLLSQSAAQTACQDDRFHGRHPSAVVTAHRGAPRGPIR
jgi:hypothetical protein